MKKTLTNKSLAMWFPLIELEVPLLEDAYHHIHHSHIVSGHFAHLIGYEK